MLARFFSLLLLCVGASAQSVFVNGVFSNIVTPAVAPSGGGNVTAGLHNWWKFDENTGTTAEDSISGNTATLNAGASWGTGQINSALSLDGTAGAYCDLANPTIDGSGGMTIAFWYNVTAGSTAFPIYDSDFDSSEGFILSIDNSTFNIALSVVFDSSDLTLVSAGSGDVRGAGWNHIAATWSGGTAASSAHIYTNAVECPYSLSLDGSGTHGINTTANHWIGRGTSLARFEGLLDDVRIYDRVLTSDEITALYNWRGP